MVFIMAYTTTSACTIESLLSTPRQRQKPSSQPAFGPRLAAALEHANRLTEMHGAHNIDTVVAWDTVKALLQSHPYFSTLVVPNWNSKELA